MFCPSLNLPYTSFNFTTDLLSNNPSPTIQTSVDTFILHVDSRLSRAVAIEHPKDADIAVEIVLTEIIPSITKKLLPVTPPEDVSPRVIVNLEDGSKGEGDGLALAHHQLVKSRDAGSSSSNSSSRPDLNVPVKSRQGGSPPVVINLGDDSEEDDSEEEGGLVQKHQLVEDNAIGPSSSTSLLSRSIPVQIAQTANSSGGLDLNVTLNESTLSNGSDRKDENKRFFGIDLEAYLKRGILNDIPQGTSNAFNFFEQGQLDVDFDSENLASSHVYQVAENEQNKLNEEWVDFAPTDENVDAKISDTTRSLENCETSLNELEGSEVQTVSQLQEHTPVGEDYLQMVINSNPSVIVGETSHVEDEIDVNKTLSQNSRSCSIDTLEETQKKQKKQLTFFLQVVVKKKENKDADIAVEIVLTEIIPSITKKLLPVTPPEDVSPRVIVNLEYGSEGEGDGPDLNVLVKSRQGGSPLVVINLGDDSEEDDSEEEGGLVQKHQLVEDNAIGPSSSTSLSSRSIPVLIAQTANSSGGLDLNVTLNESTLGILNDIPQGTSNGFNFFEQGQLDVDFDSENLASSRVYQVAENEHNKLNEDWVDFAPTDENVDAKISDTTRSLENCETALNELEGSEVQTVSQLQEHTPVGEDYLQMVINSNPSFIIGETSHVEDEIDVNKTLSQNSRSCSIDTLEETQKKSKKSNSHFACRSL
ncbi:hypothetical protein RYX36_006607 [Vicia faba]